MEIFLENGNIVRAILSVYDPDSERVRSNLEQPEAEVQKIVIDIKNNCFFFLISKA